jgi:thiamine biosynthesis protein ThiS
MNITVNGKPHEVVEKTTVAELIQKFAVAGPLAVELNQQICPKRTHGDTYLAPGDVVEIVTIVAGG